MRLLSCWLLALSMGGLCSLGQAQAPPAKLASGGPGDLLIAPGRLVFEGRARTAALNLTNIGLQKATYRITMVRMEMSENGSFKELPPNPEADKDLFSLFSYSPHEVVLESQESQAVRFLVKKPANLAPGEYRVHLVFRAIPPTPDPTAPPKNDGTISISLTPIYGLSIPLIMRHGDTSAVPSISQLSLDKDQKHLLFDLNRSGNQSVYGNLEATLVPLKGASKSLAKMNGVAVYANLSARHISLPLPADIPLPKGSRIQVTFSAPVEAKGTKLAQAEFLIP